MASRLKTPGDVRRYLAKVITDLQAGKIEATTAGRIGYLCNILVRVMEVGFQQSELFAMVKRLEQLEKGQ